MSDRMKVSQQEYESYFLRVLRCFGLARSLRELIKPGGKANRLGRPGKSRETFLAMFGPQKRPENIQYVVRAPQAEACVLLMEELTGAAAATMEELTGVCAGRFVEDAYPELVKHNNHTETLSGENVTAYPTIMAAASDYFLELYASSGFTVWAVTPEVAVRLSGRSEFSNWGKMPRDLSTFLDEKDACILRGVRQTP